MQFFKHQRELIDKKPLKWLLNWSTGVGKSCTAIKLAELSGLHNVLVICPKSLVENWENELLKFAKEPRLFKVLSKENFKKQAETLPKYNKLVLDEIHHYGSIKSQLFKATHKYIKKHEPKQVYGLSATCYRNEMLNLLALGWLFGKPWRYIDFMRCFYTKVKMGHRWIPVQRKTYLDKPMSYWAKDLIEKMGSIVDINKVFDVPKQIYLQEYFDLTKEQIKGIESLDSVEPIVYFTHKHCIENGILKSDGYTESQYFKCEKNDRAVELANEHPKIALVCRYKLQMQYIKSKLKNKKVFIIDGDTEDKFAIVEEINNSEGAVVLIQAATSCGYNLWSVPIMVFLSYDFSLVNLVQMKGRLQRAGHIKRNVYISLVNKKGTIDHHVWDCVENKKMDFHHKLIEK